MDPTPPAPIAAGPIRPAITTSTNPIAIQPSSAITRGPASRIMGRSSLRTAAIMP